MKKLKKFILPIFLSMTLLFYPFTIFQQTRSVYAEMASYQTQFIQSLAPTAIALGKQYGLFPSIMLAQAILESDWGRSGLASAPYYNLFGIKSPDGDDSGVIFSTQEDDGFGNLYTIRDSFRRYNNITESMYDYAKLFTSTHFLERHYANFLNAATVQEAAAALTGTYATDTRYGQSLMNIIVAYNLLQFDASVGRAPSWSLTATNDIVYVTHNEVNLRKNHSTSDEPVGRAQANDKFFRLGYVTGWSLLQLSDGSKLYIASQFIQNSPLADEPAGRDFTLGIQGITPTPESNTMENTSDSIGSKPKEKVSIGLGNLTESIYGKTEENPNKPASLEDLFSSNQGQPAAAEEEPVDALGYSSKEVEAAKALADKAIANQQNNPSQAPSAGVIDARTVVDEKNTQVNKNQLEKLLTSNINLPFVSDEKKKAYAKLLQSAKAAYYNAKSTQAQVDALVKELNALKSEAELENEEGTQKDLTEQRKKLDAETQVQLEYTKQALEGEHLNLSVQKSRKPSVDNEALAQLNDLGERVVQYQLHLKDDFGFNVHLKDKVKFYLPIPEDMDASSLILYRLKDRYTLVEMKPRLDEPKNALVLETQEVGTYLLVEKRTVQNSEKISKFKQQGLVYAAESLSDSEKQDLQELSWIFPYLMIFAVLLSLRLVYLSVKGKGKWSFHL